MTQCATLNCSFTRYHMLTPQTPTQLGKFITFLETSKEFLTISFSPAASARQERWRNYGLSADFLGDYFATFFPGSAPEKGSGAENMGRATIKAAISYIANELLENAIKYHTELVQEPISISLFLYEDSIVFQAINLVDQDREAQFRSFIHRLLSTDDIDQLFSEQLEQVAQGSGESNMGYLTMMCDYGVEFGWQFQPSEHGAEISQTDVQAHLSLKATF